jgi:predicted amidohydrolase
MYNCYIVPGSFLERDPESTKLVFNTQILIGPEGVIHRYRKYQPWWSHEPSVSPHDLLPAGYDTKKYPLFPVSKTEIGNIGGWICYDCCFPEIARELAYNGCEIFVGSTAYMDPYGRPPLDTWTTCCRARSIENTAYGVYAGSGCGCEKLASYPTSGLSSIVDFEGRILATGGGGETYTAAILDIDALRDHRKHARLENHLAHCRIEGYTYLKEKKAWTPQAQLKDKDDLTLAEADEINAKEIEKFWSKYYNEKVTVPRWRPPQWSKP